MYWKDIEQICQSQVNTDIEAGKRFTPYYFRLIAGMVQAEMASLIKCIAQSNNYTTTIGTAGYSIPDDCVEVFRVKYDSIPLADQTERRIMPTTSTTSVPYAWSLFGNQVVLYPSPSGAKTLEMWFYKRPAPYHIDVVHVPDSGATQMYMTVSSTAISFVGTGGSDTGTTTVTCTGNSVAGVASAINSVMATVTATVSPEAYSSDLWGNTTFENRTSVKIFNGRELIMAEPTLPAEYQPGLIAGILEYMGYKDKEYNAMGINETKYRGLIKRYIAERRKHLNAQNNNGIRRRYKELGAYPVVGGSIIIP